MREVVQSPLKLPLREVLVRAIVLAVPLALYHDREPVETGAVFAFGHAYREF
jgi:hypothetical protein